MANGQDLRGQLITVDGDDGKSYQFKWNGKTPLPTERDLEEAVKTAEEKTGVGTVFTAEQIAAKGEEERQAELRRNPMPVTPVSDKPEDKWPSYLDNLRYLKYLRPTSHLPEDILSEVKGAVGSTISMLPEAIKALSNPTQAGAMALSAMQPITPGVADPDVSPVGANLLKQVPVAGQLATIFAPWLSEKASEVMGSTPESVTRAGGELASYYGLGKTLFSEPEIGKAGQPSRLGSAIERIFGKPEPKSTYKPSGARPLVITPQPSTYTDTPQVDVPTRTPPTTKPQPSQYDPSASSDVNAPSSVSPSNVYPSTYETLTPEQRQDVSNIVQSRFGQRPATQMNLPMGETGLTDSVGNSLNPGDTLADESGSTYKLISRGLMGKLKVEDSEGIVRSIQPERVTLKSKFTPFEAATPTVASSLDALRQLDKRTALTPSPAPAPIPDVTPPDITPPNIIPSTTQTPSGPTVKDPLAALKQLGAATSVAPAIGPTVSSLDITPSGVTPSAFRPQPSQFDVGAPDITPPKPSPDIALTGATVQSPKYAAFADKIRDESLQKLGRMKYTDPEMQAVVDAEIARQTQSRGSL